MSDTEQKRLRQERHFNRFGTWPGPDCWTHGPDCLFRNTDEALAAKKEHVPAQRFELKLTPEALERTTKRVSEYALRQKLRRQLAEAVAGLALVETLLERANDLPTSYMPGSVAKLLEVVRELRKAAES
jgi:hypothetical protein